MIDTLFFYVKMPVMSYFVKNNHILWFCCVSMHSYKIDDFKL